MRDIDQGALEEAVDNCLQRQKNADCSFFFCLWLPKRYVVPITNNRLSSKSKIFQQLLIAYLVCDELSIMNSLLSDGSWSMDVAMSTDDLDYAKVVSEATANSRYLDLREWTKHHSSG